MDNGRFATEFGTEVKSQIVIIHETPTLTFIDTTTGEDNWRILADGDNFKIQQKVGGGAWTTRLEYDATAAAWEFSGDIDLLGDDILDAGSITCTTMNIGSLSGVVHATGGLLSASNVVLTSEVTGTLPVANGGTNSSASLTNSRIMVSTASAIVESDITTTELGYLDDVTSSIQDQLDARFETETITLDLDFTSASSVTVSGSLSAPIQEIIRGRLYVDADPGAGFAAWATVTLYNDSDLTGETAYYRTEARLVYTELAVATTGGNTAITPDDESDFAPDALAYIIDGGSSEFTRLETIAATMTAEDNVAAHAINTGLVRVSEFSGFSVWDNDIGNGGDKIYMKVEFASDQTVSLKCELELRT